MSFGAMSDAWDLTGVSPAEKIVLLGLGSYANEAGFCFPSQDKLVAHTCLSASTIKRALKALEERGLIERERRHYRDGSRAANGYYLRFGRFKIQAVDLTPRTEDEVQTKGSPGPDQGVTVTPPTSLEPVTEPIREPFLEVSLSRPYLGDFNEDEPEEPSVIGEEAPAAEPPEPPVKGRARKPQRALPDGCPSAELIEAQQAKAREAGADVDVDFEAGRFRDWNLSKDNRYADWDAAFRTWIARRIKEAPRLKSAGPSNVVALAPNVTPRWVDLWRGRVGRWMATGEWPGDVGLPPDHKGTQVPDFVREEFGIRLTKEIVA